MNELLQYFINTDNVFQKGLFLMVAGVVFVFLIQTFFFITIKFWLRKKKS